MTTRNVPYPSIFCEELLKEKIEVNHARIK
jgi:hypothetical protein